MFNALLLLLLGAGAWKESANRHSSQVPYLLYSATPSDAIVAARYQNFTWQQRLALRSWCQLRAGLIVLKHLGGKVSHAKFQRCIFCDMAVRNGVVHVLSKCVFWSPLRDTIGLAADRTDLLTIAILSSMPGDAVFKQVLLFADDIAEHSRKFWQAR